MRNGYPICFFLKPVSCHCIFLGPLVYAALEGKWPMDSRIMHSSIKIKGFWISSLRVLAQSLKMGISEHRISGDWGSSQTMEHLGSLLNRSITFHLVFKDISKSKSALRKSTASDKRRKTINHRKRKNRD
jgi:hypothetical protein